MITFDSLMLKAFITEQKDFFTGARINKIQQPTRREFIFTLRNDGVSKIFYVNINPKFYHVCFTDNSNLEKRGVKIPSKPPMFCMLLRKYLSNARISKINQPDGDRILEFYIETYNELNDKIYLCLAFELMGKYSNVILYNTDTSIILGCAHNVGEDKSSVREVYGTIPYAYPPKIDDKNFVNSRYGFLLSYKNEIFYVKNPNQIFDNYYSSVMSRDLYRSLKSRYKTLISQRLNKVEKSLKLMNYQIEKSSSSDKYRLWGDLIMANLYNLKDYSSEVEVFDYENDCQIIIKLKKEKTLKDNANIYYKKYNKLKTSKQKLTELISFQIQRKEYFEQLLFSIDTAKNIDDLKELTDEVESEEPIVKYDKNSIEPIKIIVDDNTRIYIGKNNKQNDYIVSKLADEDDLWFHTKDCAGSHVLLKAQNVTDDLILQCVKLAKQYSSASESSKIGVIYTKRKYLRKPPKANLGYVTYRNEKEIVVD